jgi:hypothetical protein
VTERLAHLDEDGRPCTRHAPVAIDALLHLATIGSRMSSFHHDVASKLQGLMMALDEISELAEPRGDTDLLRAAETAHTSLKELHQLLNANRTLAKPPIRTHTALRELATRAGERVGVTLRGDLVDANLEIAVPITTHGLALALDVAAGVGRSRALDVTSRIVDERVELNLALSPTPPANASEALAIAAWVVAREGGELRCSDSRLVVRLPIVS